MMIATTTTPLKYSERDLLQFILSRAASGGNPAALWRMPGSSLTHLIVSDQHQEIDREEFIEELDRGFLFAPFDRESKRIFLKADQLFTFENGELRRDGTPESDAAYKSIFEAGLPETPRKYQPPMSGPAPSDVSNREAFISIVNTCLEQIEKGIFEKIVPSRNRVVDLGDRFDVIDAFQRLSKTYPEALISYVSIPGIGNWLGASPELLVSVIDKKIFKTVALAGTLPYTPGIDLRSVAWTQKEIEEQALVERYVISCFKRVRLREYEEHGPRTVVAGNLMHLKSEFTVDIKATNFPQIGSVMLDLLHPTSAVCGMPLEPSLEFLKQHESYDRGFYSGFLGPVHVHNNIELFVNIRCMQISGTRGILYAGAGVTVDSIPDKEWDETEMKLQTLLNVIA
jgi:isochorismate synthase